MNVRLLSPFSRHLLTAVALALIVAGVSRLAGQNAATSLLVLSRDGRRVIPISTSGGQEMIALEDLASTFQLAVREERDALTVSYKGRTIVLTPDQAIASVSGRLVALSAPPSRANNRWIVPIDIISRALLPIYDARLELRRPSRLLIVGDLRVPQVTVHVEPAGSATRVTLDSQPRATATVSQDGNQRVTVKFDVDAIDVTMPASPQGLVQGIRSIDLTTLAIDLAPAFRSFRTSTPVSDGRARVVIDLLSSADATPGPTTTQAEPPMPAELPAIHAPSLGVRTLAIDAGHGGNDIGAKGPKGTTEKAVTLALARRLKATVEGRLGLRVIMSREDDRGLPVSERTALANNNKADLFVSLHANASFRNTVSGASIYVASFDEGAVIEGLKPVDRLPAFGGGFRDIELVPWNLAQIRHRHESEILAKLIAEEFRDRVPLAARPVDHARLRVLESANMAAVLVEVGYLTNPDQEARLGDGDFQGVVVQGIVDAIVRFRDALTLSEESPQ